MEYRKIISVTGLGGLFELMGTKSDGAIVRSLEDKTTKFVSSRVHNFSHLESIEVYTQRDNVNLLDVFRAMDVSKEKMPDEKDAKAIKSYFEKVYPEMDFDRVYGSDMKKMVRWFSVLKKNEVELPAPLNDEEETAETVAAEAPQPKEAVEESPAEGEKKPKKKAAPRKKKTEE